MRRKYELLPTQPLLPEVSRFDRARAARVARRLEAHCRRAVPGCTVRARRRAAGLELEVGTLGSVAADRLRIADFDLSELTDDTALQRLADVISVWIEPAPAATRPVGFGAAADGSRSRV